MLFLYYCCNTTDGNRTKHTKLKPYFTATMNRTNLIVCLAEPEPNWIELMLFMIDFHSQGLILTWNCIPWYVFEIISGGNRNGFRNRTELKPLCGLWKTELNKLSSHWLNPNQIFRHCKTDQIQIFSDGFNLCLYFLLSFYQTDNLWLLHIRLHFIRVSGAGFYRHALSLCSVRSVILLPLLIT